MSIITMRKEVICICKPEKIIIVFKTHLDMGFTDLAENIVNQYMDVYIPQAIKVARELRNLNSSCRFIWTTGSWLINTYLETSNEQKRLEMIESINNGDISWHGLPFTTHTEIMSKELFCHGLSISQKLDKQFNRKTIGAKMTDVPGHTRAMIPLLAKAGIEFLHIGVNPASKAVDVPEVFRWQGSDNNEVVVMYNKGSYGKFTNIPGTKTAVYFAHTGDNKGPQSAQSIVDIYDELQKEYPSAQLVAGDLDTVADAVLKVKSELPIVAGEMGDTWIHGTCSNPKRASQYREMLRLLPSFEKSEQEKAMDYLLMVPEHTWGLDEKTFLNDHHNMVRCDFEKARKNDSYVLMEESWQEQNKYVTDAVMSLASGNKEKAIQAMQNYKKKPIDFSQYQVVENKNEIITINGYKVKFDENGAISYLENSKRVLADHEHLWGLVKYELFSENEHARFVQQYVVCDEDWAVEDFGKIGMEEAISKYRCETPKMKGLFQKGNELVAVLEFSDECRELYGAPKEITLGVLFNEDKIELDLAWWNKPANRTPESFWISINPMAAKNLKVRKLGEWIDPKAVISNGNRNLHGTDWGIKYDNISIQSLDGLAVAIGKTSLWNFDNEMPNCDNGVYFNLYNNIWGTNFTMWYDEDARYRFEIKI